MGKIKFGLGKKIGFGFSLLIVIMLILFGFAITSMKKVTHHASLLAEQYAPCIKVLGLTQAAIGKAIGHMRAYESYQQIRAWEDSIESMNQVNKYLIEASSHIQQIKSQNATSGAIHKDMMTSMEKAIAEYGQLAKQTFDIYDRVRNDFQKLDMAAATYNQAYADFIDHHTQMMVPDSGLSVQDIGRIIDELVKANEALALGREAEKLVLKFYSLSEPELTELIYFTLQDFDRMETILRELIGQFSDSGPDKQLKASMKDAIGAVSDYRDALNDLQQNWGPLRDVSAKRRQIADSIMEKALSITMTGIDETKDLADDAENALSHVLKVISIGFFIAVVVALVLSYFITRMITQPIHQIIEELSETSTQVASASDQISSASHQLSDGSSDQAAAIQQTASSLEQMASMTRKNADNAVYVDQEMKGVKHVIENTNTSMNALTTSMSDIRLASENTYRIIKTIDEIAFQTSLLALNAAVEAARAGQAGAGFAVVADEVRRLALRSAEAAKTTASLINGIAEKIGDGSAIVDQTYEAFSKVAESVNRVSELVAEITVASNEQAMGIDQINRGVGEMDKVTQQNAATAQQAASSSQQMYAQADRLKTIVYRLVTLVEGERRNHQIKSRTGKPAATLSQRITQQTTLLNANKIPEIPLTGREKPTRNKKNNWNSG